MKDEIFAAVNFLTCLLGKNTDITAEQVKVFQDSLSSILTEKFEGHWFPDQPYKGQAYRCIRVNSSVPCDSALEQAAKMCGLRYENLKLPLELTIWVDPHEVCCRFGERDGSFFTIASFKNDKENTSNNIQDNVSEVSPVLNQVSSDSKKPKNCRRKVTNERAKKPISSRQFHTNLKGFPPNSKNLLLHSSNYYDWNPAHVPYSSRMPHYPDFPFMHRPRKVVRSVYLNDRHPWFRK